MNKWKNEWINVWINEHSNECMKRMNPWMKLKSIACFFFNDIVRLVNAIPFSFNEEWLHEWWMNGKMNRWMNE